MSPRVADPAVRTTLIEAAARLLATEGPDALTLRRLAEDAGTSTMAIYTHFGGMTELRREVRREGFARLAAHLSAPDRTLDAVEDVAILGWAYFTNALANPNLYRAMFMEPGIDEDDGAIGIDTFETLVDAVRRCIDAGRFHAADAAAVATQLWALTHGIVTLHLAGFLPVPRAAQALLDATRNLFVGYGDHRRRVTRSLGRAASRAEAVDRPGVQA